MGAGHLSHGPAIAANNKMKKKLNRAKDLGKVEGHSGKENGACVQ